MEARARKGLGLPRGRPPLRWLVIVLGLLLVVWGASEAVNAATAPSEFCTTCHVMGLAYDTWEHSAHRAETTCNDCHVSHANYLAKTYTKAVSGVQHVLDYTLGDPPQRIRLKSDPGLIRENCLRCHGRLVAEVMDPQRDCWECHRYTPHANLR